MADLVVIFGPGAVGKASVGQALAEKTGYRLFHNHLTTDPVAQLLGWDHPQFQELTWDLRLRLFRAALAEPLHPGVIFTFVWAFNVAEDGERIAELRELFLSHGRRVRFVELSADLSTRLAREGTPQRLQMKPAKRDVEWARSYLEYAASNYQDQSLGQFPWPNDWLLIDTEQHQPDQAAERIIAQWPSLFNLAMAE
ncbi:shikimate kinase [Chitinibacter fontanus]|uniref:Shikimate kinase n=1 Tax=Chitinibacter fontanus TaxID=1737446 RepID=A0A7D5ZE69_9NEIS|nr:shikimate kinase [Chitinibacter fontanus]QLI81484.1 shikimate kinase [Chitinibacter fontanus]